MDKRMKNENSETTILNLEEVVEIYIEALECKLKYFKIAKLKAENISKAIYEQAAINNDEQKDVFKRIDLLKNELKIILDNSNFTVISETDQNSRALITFLNFDIDFKNNIEINLCEKFKVLDENRIKALDINDTKKVEENYFHMKRIANYLNFEMK
jgi:hypothetical protein